MNDVRDSIGWAEYTWNPITGCKRGCAYCYARRIHERFYKTPFADIQFHGKRILDPVKHKTPATIFVGSMSDPEYWPKEYYGRVLDVCENNRQHTFMFLSKSPKAYMHIHKWPKNTMQGLTITSSYDVGTYYSLTAMCSLPRPFLSIEPLLGPVLYHNAFQAMERIIVGAMTGPRPIAPQKEWIDGIRNCIPADKIFWKNNIKRYL